MMSQVLNRFLCIVLCLGLFAACGNDSNDGSTDQQESEKTSSQTDNTDNKSSTLTTAPSDVSESVYAWVDPLNVRDAPNRKGKIVATVNSTQPLEVTGQKSDQPETIVLRGIAFNEPWVQIKTPDGKIGWVFGGAVKLQDEAKGTGLSGKSEIDFPHFGTYDLGEWTKGNTEEGSGGDAEFTTTIYERGNEELIVRLTEMGEYGYTNSYELRGKNNKLLKSRELVYSTMPTELTETVVDYTKRPAEQFQRIQPMELHHSRLNARPTMVNGPWQYTTVTENAEL